jgi:hypothetical protein
MCCVSGGELRQQKFHSSFNILKYLILLTGVNSEGEVGGRETKLKATEEETM